MEEADLIAKATVEAREKWKPRASAKNNRDFISIESYSSFNSALADPKADEHLLFSDASDEEAGTTVLEALRQSRFLSYDELVILLENNQQNYQNWIQKLMSLYGYKTKRALFKNMKSCDISLKDGMITIEHTNHEKLEAWGGEGISKEDYVHIPADSSPAEIGAALRLAFSRCIGMGA
jgi:hypothetical protein